MEVRIGELDIAQHRGLEAHAVLVAARDGLHAFGGVGRFIGTNEAHLLEGLATNLSAVVADRAAQGLEEVVALQFLSISRRK